MPMIPLNLEVYNLVNLQDSSISATGESIISAARISLRDMFSPQSKSFDA
jgi:hypothetical protein